MTTGQSLSVGITATCSDTEIVLHADKTIYAVWKKLPTEKEWGAPRILRLIGFDFVDIDVEPGTAYEYKIQSLDGATGYIQAGSAIPFVESRGKLVLIIESTYVDALAVELARFQADLAGDGYEVIRHVVFKTSAPDAVKDLIRASNAATAILFGAVPVRMSGPENYDGHGMVMVSADTFYGNLDGDWSGNPSIIPGKIQVAVGRIDFSNLTCFKNKLGNARNELDLLREYLNRNHAWRTVNWKVTPRGGIRDGFDDRDFSRNGWANMPQLCRSGIEAIPDGQFFRSATDKDYLLVHACGGGQLTSMAGTGGSDDFATNDIRITFLMLLGSAFLGRWNVESAFLRCALASGNDEKGCLAAFGAGAPHVFLHKLGLGGTIGESFVLSENNFTIYPPTGNVEPGIYTPSQSSGIPPCSGLVHQSLQGDPTLGFYPLKAVTGLLGSVSGKSLNLLWDDNFEANYGYRIYQGANPSGPFELIAETMRPFATIPEYLSGFTYMVRAIKLVETPSGSFYGLSCGVFWIPPSPPSTPGTPMSKVTFIEDDRITQGMWVGKYGQDGGVIASGPKRLPMYASVIAGAPEYAWSTGSSEVRALQSGNDSLRIAAVFYATQSFVATINSDANQHRIALYFLDWDRAGRRQRVEILDAATDAVLDSRDIEYFGNGLWLVYDFQGSIKIRLTKLAGPNAVLNGIFFGPAAQAPVPTPTPTQIPGTRTIEVLCSTDGGANWRSVAGIEVASNSIFKIDIK